MALAMLAALVLAAGGAKLAMTRENRLRGLLMKSVDDYLDMRLAKDLKR